MYNYNRILLKTNYRFNVDDQSFYPIIYQKINQKLIPQNLESVLKRLGYNKSLKKYISCRVINLDINSLMFEGKFNKYILN